MKPRMKAKGKRLKAEAVGKDPTGFANNTDIISAQGQVCCSG